MRSACLYVWIVWKEWRRTCGPGIALQKSGLGLLSLAYSVNCDTRSTSQFALTTCRNTIVHQIELVIYEKQLDPSGANTSQKPVNYGVSLGWPVTSCEYTFSRISVRERPPTRVYASCQHNVYFCHVCCTLPSRNCDCRFHPASPSMSNLQQS